MVLHDLDRKEIEEKRRRHLVQISDADIVKLGKRSNKDRFAGVAGIEEESSEAEQSQSSSQGHSQGEGEPRKVKNYD